MARDTVGPVPVGTSDLRRVSNDAPHWHQVRWCLGAQALIAGGCGAAGLIAIYLLSPVRTQFRVIGLSVTPALSWALIGIAAAAAIAASRRRVALLFTAITSVATLLVVIVAAVATTHSSPGPLGFDAAAIVLWAVLFAYNFGLGIWLIPDHIEGPDWIPRRRRPSRATDSDHENA